MTRVSIETQESFVSFISKSIIPCSLKSILKQAKQIQNSVFLPTAHCLLLINFGENKLLLCT